MLLSIAGVIFVLWLLGWMIHFGGSLIHLLLLVAIIMFTYNQISGREK